MAERPAPRVSVVVPTRGRDELLGEALAAIAAQDLDGSIECLVVHDGPCDELPADADRDGGRIAIRHLRNHRQPGLAGARNTGITAARADWIAFCDDDDTWAPQKLRLQLELLESGQGHLVAGCANTVVYGDHRTIRHAPDRPVDFDDLLRSRVAVLHSSTIVASRQAILGSIGLISEEIPGGASEDYEWQLRASRVAPIAVLAEPLVDISWHEGSLYARRWDLYVAGLRWILDRYPEFDRDAKGRARLLGQIAFGYAAAGHLRAAARWALRSMRADLAQPRAYLAVLVSIRALPPEALLHRLHARGKGI
jgi:glycosyltransferase involved in cell wall biosynthesis